MEKVAKELVFSPIVRVVVPKGGSNGWEENEYAEIVAREKIRKWTKEEILDWIFENHEDTFPSYEEYDAEYDEEDNVVFKIEGNE
jgi:hypothetical protein